MHLVVAIPCLNEEASIGQVLRDVPTTLPGITRITKLVIDDGSTDRSAEESKANGAFVIRHVANRGVGEAFKTALSYAVSQRADLMVNIDADGQFAPADIVKVINPIVTHEADFVTASRFVDATVIPDMPAVKHWGNKRMSDLISLLSGRRFYDVSCGFRAYSREAMLNLNLHGKFTYTQETFLDLSIKNIAIKEVPVHVRYFPGRKSRVAGNLFQYAYKTSKIIFRCYRDYFPLRFFWSIALFFALWAVVFGAIFWGHFFMTGRFSGQLWAGFMSGFFLMVGLAFLITGVVADMFDRMRSNQEKILYLLKKSGMHEPSIQNRPNIQLR